MHTDVRDELRDQVAAVMSDRAGIQVPVAPRPTSSTPV